MLKQRLILIGGGHSHALVLRMFAMEPRPELELVLISPVADAPYSGMLPAHIAGQYSKGEMHIDLRRLARAAGAIFLQDSVTDFDRALKRVSMAAHPSMAGDVISINTGSTPELQRLPGAQSYGQGVKPVPDFLQHWAHFKQTLDTSRQTRIVIVGGGAGGVELAFCMQAALAQKAMITLVQGASELLPSHHPRVRRMAEQELLRQGIAFRKSARAARVTAGRLELEDGSSLVFDALYLATGASAPNWFRQSGMQCDAQGFLSIDSRYQVIGEDGIFAVGDCASLEINPRPKSGVFAVRQGRPLYENICRYLDGEPLGRYRLQKQFLSLLGTGDGRAIASRGAFATKGAWVWRWKDSIDRGFMRKFSDLKIMPRTVMAKATEMPAMRCLGCGSKLAGSVLSEALDRVSRDYPEAEGDADVLWGLSAREDTAAFRVPAGAILLQSLDSFPALVEDPFLMGKIACNHAFSDIFAKGGRAHSALVLAVLPEAKAALQVDTLHQLLSGVCAQLQRFQARLLGGHSTEGSQLTIGLSVNGLIQQDPWSKRSLQDGDVLLLSKPLGTGLIFAGAMQGYGKGEWQTQAIASMLLDNQESMQVAQKFSVHAATDVTGFGLLGHLLEMLKGTGMGAELFWSTLPLLQGAKDLAADGMSSSLYEANASYESRLRLEGTLPLGWGAILGDPQTSGGLLVAVPKAEANALLAQWQAGPAPGAAIIGRIQMSSDAVILRF